MATPPTQKELSDYRQVLAESNHRYWPHFHNAINAYTPPQQSTVAQVAQLRADLLQEAGLGLIVRELSRFETVWPLQLWHPNALISPASRLRMLAWRHLRHVAAHSPDGRQRVDQHGNALNGHRSEFDQVAQGHGLQGVTLNQVTDSVEIDIAFGPAFYADLDNALASGIANNTEIALYP